MPRVAAFPAGPPSGASSAASEIGPALRIRKLPVAHVRGAYTPVLLDVGLLGLTIVLGGQYFNWNAAFAAGLFPAATAFVLMGSAYVVLVFSLAEVASVFPFAGGAYAIARTTLGFFGGFLVGAIDALEFVAYVSASVLALGDLTVAAAPALRGLEPVVWLLFYTSAALLQSRSHAVFWRVNALLAVASLAILLAFGVGAVRHCDVRRHTVGVMDVASRTPVARPSLAAMVRVLPFCAWFYVGIDAVVLVADHVPTPRTVVPRAQRGSVLVLVATAMLTFFVAAALPEDMGVTADARAPLAFGFSTFTPLTATQATWLSLPATYATAFGFAWAYARLVAALAASGLLPRWLAVHIQQQVRRNQGLSSRTALATGSTLSLVVCLVVHYGSHNVHVLSNVCIGLAFLSYMAQTLGFISLRRAGRIGGTSVSSSGRGHGDALVRSTYRSPFGVYGAYASLVVWLLGFVSVVGFQDSGFVELVVIATVLVVLTLYYALYAHHHQLFSADERDVVMAAAIRPSQRHGLVQASLPAVGGTAGTGAGTVTAASKSRVPTASDADGSFASGAGAAIRTGSGSLRMPQLVRAGSKLINLMEEEHTGLTDDMDEPYVADWPLQPQPQPQPQLQLQPLRPQLQLNQPNQPQASDHDVLSASFTAGTSSTRTPLAPPLRRGGSDGVLTSSVLSSAPIVLPPVQAPAPRRESFMAGGFGRSFLARHGLERLREETDRDLRSAVSGLWSERSQRWSRGRAS